MRWPWSRPEAAKPVAAPAPKAWESMSAIRPAMPAVQRVTDSSAFTSALTSWQRPGVVGPMEHALDADAPTGVVDGLVTVLGAERPTSPAAAPTPAPTLPERHRSLPTSARPRHVARIVAAEPAPVSTVGPRATSVETALEVTPAAEPLGDVAPSDLVEPAGITDASSTPPSAPVVPSTLPAVDAVPTLAAPPTPPAADAGGRPSVGRSGPRPALPVQRTPIDHRSTPGAGAPPAPPAAAPPMRRLGLGAPRSSTDPSSPVVSRIADAAAAPAAAAPASASAAPPAGTAGSTGSGATTGIDMALATMADATASAVPTLGAGTVVPAESPATFGGGRTAAASGGGSAPTIARLQRVGPDAPMVAAAPVRRAAPAVPSLVGTAATAATAVPTATPPPGGAVLQRSAVDGGSSILSRTSEVGASAAGAHGAAMPSSGAIVAPDGLLWAEPTGATVPSSMPRSIPTLGAGRAPGISSAPLAASGGGAVIAREVVATGGRPGSIPSGSPSRAAFSGPAPTASRLGSSASRPTAAAAAVGAPLPAPGVLDPLSDLASPDVVVSREADGSMSLTATASPAAHTEVGLRPDPIPIQRDADESVVVSRAADDGAAGGGSAGVPGGAPSGDLDGLARQLYGRLRSELVAELRLDRERAGLRR